MQSRRDARPDQVIRLRLDDDTASAVARDRDFLDGLNRCVSEKSASQARASVEGDHLLVPVEVLDETRRCLSLAADQRLRQLSLRLYSEAVAMGWLS